MYPPFMALMLIAISTIGALGLDLETQTASMACKVPNCRDCETEYSCSYCEKDFFNQSGQCVQCLKGFYASKQGCAPCPEGCAECTSKCECSECLPGFEEDGDVCKACENYIGNCSVCSPPILDYILNGDFEDPPLESRGRSNPITHWHTFDQVNTDLVRYAPDGGEQSASITDDDDLFQVVVNLEPGESYTLSFYCRSSEDGPQVLQVTALSITEQEFTCLETDPWSFYTVTLTATTEIDQVLFFNPEDNEPIYLEAVSLVRTSDLGQSCPVCLEGFYPDMEACTACSDSNCSTCSSSVCLECKEGFGFNYSWQCASCSELFAGCEECSSSFCKKCSSEYRLSHGNCFLSNSNCIEFDGKSCKKCKEGFLLYKNFCYEAEEVACENGYFNDFGRCIECGTGTYAFAGACYICPENCDECSDGESCSKCAVGFEWKDGKCGECELYVENCSTCTAAPENILTNGDFESPEYQDADSDVPLDGWNPGLLDPDAIRDPPDGGYQSLDIGVDTVAASQEVDLESGEEYTLTFYCLSSDDDTNRDIEVSISGGAPQRFTCPAFYSKRWVQYTVTFVGGVSTDIIEFSILGNGVTIDGVVLVKSSDLVPTCSMCLEGFYISGNQCLPCSDPNCVSCPDGVCSVCKDDLLMDSEGLCKPCKEARGNCQECSESGCVKCSYGYFNWSGYCYAVKNNCILSLQGECMSCLEGYFMMYEACYKSIEGCSNYDYYGNCTHCTSGRKPWYNQCF